MLAIITLSLRVHDLTGSAFAVSALFAATMLPMVALAPLAGAVTDRFESSRVLLAASLAQVAVAVGLALVDQLAAMLALTALLASGAALAQPAEFALVPAAAAPERLAAAGGRMEAARYAGFTAGPLLAAVLVALGGGIGHGLKNALVRTVISQRVPSARHGRAFAAYNAARNASAEVGHRDQRPLGIAGDRDGGAAEGACAGRLADCEADQVCSSANANSATRVGVRRADTRGVKDRVVRLRGGAALDAQRLSGARERCTQSGTVGTGRIRNLPY